MTYRVELRQKGCGRGGDEHRESGASLSQKPCQNAADRSDGNVSKCRAEMRRKCRAEMRRKCRAIKRLGRQAVGRTWEQMPCQDAPQMPCRNAPQMPCQKAVRQAGGRAAGRS